MELSTHIEKNNLHHAYAFAGDSVSLIENLEAYFKDTLLFSTHGNPDYQKEEFINFGVDDGHRIAASHLKKAIAGNKKIYLISVSSFSHEAQNALLKMFEEPTSNTHFFIIVPSFDILLPTLRSRLFSIKQEADEKGMETKQAATFFKSSIADRIKMLEGVIEEKDKVAAQQLLNELERYAHVQFLKNTSDSNLASFLQDVVNSRGYLRGRAPSLKMILEHLIHTAPTL